MRYVNAPLSIRFDPVLLERLRRRARTVPGATASGLAQRLVDEGLRTGEHPGIIFKDGPTGRRAALAGGPDVWEIVNVLRELDERGEAAVDASAALLNLTDAQVRTALAYYAAYDEEIDAEIADNEEASRAAEKAWQVSQQLLG